ncbi:MAG TPA: AIR synthase-related protein, partial [Pseudolysinimonas sp.]
WQFSQAVEGLADACLELGIPVTGGNVSFYNQTGDVPIHPTPVVAVMGTIDDVGRRVPSGWQDSGDNLYLLGSTHLELDGSAWAAVIHGHLGGTPPKPHLKREQELAALLSAAAHEGLLNAAHDLSDGGLATALVDGCLRFGIGARVWLDELLERDQLDALTTLFSESGARAIVAVPREEDVKFLRLCEGRNYPVARIGVTDRGAGDVGASLELQDLFTVTLDELRTTSRATMADHFGPVVGYSADLSGAGVHSAPRGGRISE